MKTISIPAFGGPEQLQLLELPEPEPAAGEVLVKLEFAGLNFIDVYMRSGHYARSQNCAARPCWRPPAARKRRRSLKRAAPIT